MNKAIDTAIVFGGTGFIGTHLAQHWLRERLANKLVLVDLAPPREEPYTAELQSALKDGRASYVRGDVRNSAWREHLPERADLIFNLAAIHREPGHKPQEYFETNLQGA